MQKFTIALFLIYTVGWSTFQSSSKMLDSVCTVYFNWWEMIQTEKPNAVFTLQRWHRICIFYHKKVHLQSQPTAAPLLLFTRFIYLCILNVNMQ